MKKNNIYILFFLLLILTGCDIANIDMPDTSFVTQLKDNKSIIIDACNLSGDREKNVKVNVGYNKDDIKRVYEAYTNETKQLVYVHANEITLQNDDIENVKKSNRYCNDEAKVKGVESKTLDEGHAIADSLGGVSNSYNITPQNSYVNRSGTQSQFEHEIRDYENSNTKVTDFNYYIYYKNDTDTIPYEYYVTYRVNDKLKEYRFLNEN